MLDSLLELLRTSRLLAPCSFTCNPRETQEWLHQMVYTRRLSFTALTVEQLSGEPLPVPSCEGAHRWSLSSVVQIVKLIVFLAVPNGQAWILMNWVSSKAYINSIFAMCVP